MRKVGVTLHAVERYRERVKPHLTFEEARAELVDLAQTAPAIEPPSYAGLPRLCLQFAPGVVGCCEHESGRRSRFRLTTVLVDPERPCSNPYCHNGWVPWGNNESGAAPAQPCNVCQ